MRNNIVKIYKVVFVLLCLILANIFSFSLAEERYPTVQKISLENRIKSALIRIITDEIVDYEFYELSNPLRIIVDPLGKVDFKVDKLILPPDEGIVVSAKVIPDRSGRLDFISIELKEAIDYTASSTDHSVIIAIGRMEEVEEEPEAAEEEVAEEVAEEVVEEEEVSEEPEAETPVVMVAEEEKITEAVRQAKEEMKEEAKAETRLAQEYDQMRERQREMIKRQYEALRSQQQKIIEDFKRRRAEQEAKIEEKKKEFKKEQEGYLKKLEEEKARLEEERKRVEEEKKRLALKTEEKRKVAEEAEKKRLGEEEAEKRRLAEEEEERKAAEEEAKKKRLAEEEEKRKAAEEAEKKRLAEEAEKKRLAEEEEKRRLAEEKEKARLAEEEKARLAEEIKTAKAEVAPEKEKAEEEIRKEDEVLKLVQTGTEVSLDNTLQIAYSNYQPLRTAKEEVKLTKERVFESKRALYPQLTAKATWEDGEELSTSSGTTASAATYSFETHSYGVQLEQPLFYSGRLRNTLKKAETENEIAEIKYDNLKNQFSFEVARSFYDLVASQRNLLLQMDLLKHGQELLNLTTRRQEKGLLTDLEFLKVQSQYNQISFQVDSGTKDITLARLKFRQMLGIDKSADEEAVPLIELPFKTEEVDFDQLQGIALRERTDLRINKLLVEAAEYEKKIARGKNSLKIDLTGFLGQSAAAYSTESLDYDEDWYIGFKASLPWGGSTAGYTYAQNETAPRLGKETRTAGESHSVEFSLLNNLGALNEEKEAEINLLKAQNELDETRKQVEAEVKEAFIDYQKSLIQVSNTIEKIKFREEEVKIYQKKTQLNQLPVSELMESMIKLADEKALYNEALADYHLARAKLNKAIGIVGYLK